MNFDEIENDTVVTFHLQYSLGEYIGYANKTKRLPGIVRDPGNAMTVFAIKREKKMFFLVGTNDNELTHILNTLTDNTSVKDIAILFQNNEFVKMVTMFLPQPATFGLESHLYKFPTRIVMNPDEYLVWHYTGSNIEFHWVQFSFCPTLAGFTVPLDVVDLETLHPVLK